MTGCIKDVMFNWIYSLTFDMYLIIEWEIQIVDANNIYCWAVSPSLPFGNFSWINSTEDFDVTSIPDDGPQGYILEVDLG